MLVDKSMIDGIIEQAEEIGRLKAIRDILDLLNEAEKEWLGVSSTWVVFADIKNKVINYKNNFQATGK